MDKPAPVPAEIRARLRELRDAALTAGLTDAVSRVDSRLVQVATEACYGLETALAKAKATLPLAELPIAAAKGPLPGPSPRRRLGASCHGCTGGRRGRRGSLQGPTAGTRRFPTDPQPLRGSPTKRFSGCAVLGSVQFVVGRRKIYQGAAARSSRCPCLSLARTDGMISLMTSIAIHPASKAAERRRAAAARARASRARAARSAAVDAAIVEALAEVLAQVNPTTSVAALIRDVGEGALGRLIEGGIERPRSTLGERFGL